MIICVIGTGYVGLCTGVGFASMGHRVVCVDIDKDKVGQINGGQSPIYEPGLEEKLKRALDDGMIRATTDLKEAIGESEACFISVPTPSRDDVEISRRLAEAGLILGVEVLDHLIIAAQGYSSLRDLGLLEKDSRAFSVYRQLAGA